MEKLSHEYDYIAFGGFAIKDITQKEYKYIPKLLEITTKNNCKVHGLGVTGMKILSNVPFHSVDSTTWLNASRFGEYQKFMDGKIVKIQAQSVGKQTIKDKIKDMQLHNLKEWIKFQNYMLSRAVR